jgi:hypothetical protein
LWVERSADDVVSADAELFGCIYRKVPGRLPDAQREGIAGGFHRGAARLGLTGLKFNVKDDRVRSLIALHETVKEVRDPTAVTGKVERVPIHVHDTDFRRKRRRYA